MTSPDSLSSHFDQLGASPNGSTSDQARTGLKRYDHNESPRHARGPAVVRFLSLLANPLALVEIVKRRVMQRIIL